MLTRIIFWPTSKSISTNEKVTLLEHALSQIKVGRLQISDTELRRNIIVLYTPLKNIFKISEKFTFLKFPVKA